jgi:hypothetical protein
VFVMTQKGLPDARFELVDVVRPSKIVTIADYGHGPVTGMSTFEPEGTGTRWVSTGELAAAAKPRFLLPVASLTALVFHKPVTWWLQRKVVRFVRGALEP